MPTRGVRKSETSALTRAVNAAPITMPMARSTTLPRRMNLRKPVRRSRSAPALASRPIRSPASNSLIPAPAAPLHACCTALGRDDEGHLAGRLVDHLLAHHDRPAPAATGRGRVRIGVEDLLGLVVV